MMRPSVIARLTMSAEAILPPLLSVARGESPEAISVSIEIAAHPSGARNDKKGRARNDEKGMGLQ